MTLSHPLDGKTNLCSRVSCAVPSGNRRARSPIKWWILTHLWAHKELAEAARLTLRHYVRDIRIFGADRIPAGPFLALSNHPGMSDTLSLFVALNRPDLKIIAFKRPFLNALPNVSKQLFYLTDDPTSRITLVRQVSTHLRNGGAALTFPAGHIEPDPDVHDGALDSLQSWTSSAGVFIRMAPETAILPVLVRGVVWKKAAYHPG